MGNGAAAESTNQYLKYIQRLKKVQSIHDYLVGLQGDIPNIDDGTKQKY
jgi:hypothetical protein